MVNMASSIACGHVCYGQLTPVSYDSNLGSNLELFEITCFFFFLHWTADQVLVFDWIVGLCQVYLLQTGPNCLEAVKY